ncbi:MAG: deoxyuridine 5-triphosphate nucleotidohydrolase [Polyangiaceae bacterium]|jgi:dUTP pyrophosphatase|nr:deoxyuridine 5-triphosphate nucleotidohydrolase [Polyangiaceae bacterium]
MTATLKLRRTGEIVVPLPAYQTPGSAGLDLCAALAEPVHIGPGERRLIPTGLSFELPEGYEAQVRPRSGLALKHGISIVNSPGTIDSDYRGEVGVVLINHGKEPFVVEPLSRIAQVVVAPVAQVRIELSDALTETTRGAGGYGSTGG